MGNNQHEGAPADALESEAISNGRADCVVRFSASLPADVARGLDSMVTERGYSNRSQALAEIIRRELVDHHSTLGGHIAGTITLLYDHHKPKVLSTLTDLQHDHTDLIVSTLHVHLDHDNCLEVLVVRGPAERVRTLADQLICAKGVKHGRMTVTASGDGHHYR